MQIYKSDSVSKYILFVCYGVIMYAAFIFYPRYDRYGQESTLSWDVAGYYMYLPALFIYKDIKKCEFGPQIIEKYQPSYVFDQAFVHEQSGNYVMKYSSGQAIAMLPGFFIAHIYALIGNDYPADGFSKPYQVGIGLWMLFYAFIGLYYLRKILLLYFNDKSVAITLLLLVIGSNYLNYAAVDQAMTHSTLFTIYTLIIYCTIVFYKYESKKYIVCLGILCGLATLIRPTEIISLLIPCLWGVSSVKDLKQRFRYLIKNFSLIIMFGIFFTSVLSIQIIYWKWVSGEWIVYSYQDQGFSFKHPFWREYLFDFKCGWLIYTPLMYLPFIGLLVFYFQKQNLYAVFLMIFLSLYLVTAWKIWDYGGTSGRAMVQYYPILSFPLTALFQSILKKPVIAKVLAPIPLLIIYFNIWWFYHSHAGNIQVFDNTKEHFFKTVGRWNSTEADQKLLYVRNSFEGIPKNRQVIYFNDYEKDTSINRIIINGNTKIQISEAFPYAQDVIIQNPHLQQKWMRFTALVEETGTEPESWRQAQFSAKFYNDSTLIDGHYFRMQRFLEVGKERELFFDVKLLDSSWTHLVITFWGGATKSTVYIDNLKIEDFDE